jgi:L-rhamnose 1-dehydrogenase
VSEPEAAPNRRTALVTGASRGIGRGIAIALGEDNYRIAINYERDTAAARETARLVRDAGGEPFVVQADVGRAEDVRQMVDAVLNEFGHLDLVVLNAGICPFTPFFEITEELWDRTHAVNLKGAFLTVQAAARSMVERGEGGRIIAISSISALVGGSAQVHYCPTKAGLCAMMRSLAIVLGPHGITCNALLPGSVATDINRADWEQPGKREHLERRIPLGRIGKPRDIGDVVKVLAREESRWINGAEIVVDGGQVINFE